MPSHDENLKRFRKNPFEEPDKEFSDEFEFFARKIDLKEEINNPKATESEQNRSKDQYIELIENDSKSLEKKNLELKSRVSSLSDGTPLTEAHRIKGGKAPKYNFGLQQFIDQLAAEFNGAGRPFTFSALEKWLSTRASQGEGYESEIPDCDEIEFYDDRVWWVDSQGQRKNLALKSIERYVQRANNRASHKTL